MYKPAYVKKICEKWPLPFLSNLLFCRVIRGRIRNNAHMVAEGIQTEYKKFSHNKYMAMGKRVHLLTSVCFFF